MTIPSSTPPNVPGPSNLPRSNMPGASGGSQGVPPAPPPPGQSGGGLFQPRNIIIAVIVVVALCCICGVIAFVAFYGINRTSGPDISGLTNLTPEQQQAALVGVDFMTKLKNSDWAGAYGLCGPALQNELGSAAALGKRISDGKAQPVSWKFDTMSPVNPDTQIDGTIVFAGNVNGTVRLVLDRAGSAWQISGFNLQPAQ